MVGLFLLEVLIRFATFFVLTLLGGLIHKPF